MPIKRTFGALVLLFCYHFSWGMLLSVVPGCDTIFVKNGNVLVVRILSESEEQIRYQYCSDGASAPVRLIFVEKIERIGRGRRNLPSSDYKAAEPTESKDRPKIQTKKKKALISDKEMLQKQKKVRFFTKAAAFFTFGAIYLVVFGAAFSVALYWLIVPFYFMGLVLSWLAKKMSKKMPNLRKERRLANLVFAISMTPIVVLLFTTVFIVLGVFLF
jgi:hypothetical protein